MLQETNYGVVGSEIQELCAAIFWELKKSSNFPSAIKAGLLRLKEYINQNLEVTASFAMGWV